MRTNACYGSFVFFLNKA